MKARVITSHNSELWERLNQLIKVESPITFARIQHWCADVRACELESILREMVQARRVHVVREWRGRALVETYGYGECSGSCECSAVASDLDAVEVCATLPGQIWRQMSLCDVRQEKVTQRQGALFD